MQTIDIYLQKKQDSNSVSSVFHVLVKKHLNGKILDIGFGNCNYLEEFRALGLECYGIDGSFVNVQNAIEKGFNAKQANFNEKLPFDDNEFDVIFSSHVFEHLESPFFTLTEIYRILKPSGKVIICVPLEFSLYLKLKGDNYFRDHQGHLYSFSTTCMKSLMHYAGFELVEQFYNILLIKRLKLNVFNKFINKLPKYDKMFGLISNEFWTIGTKKNY